MYCKICNKQVNNASYIEDITGCCIDCLRLFTEPDEEANSEENDDYLTEHWLFKQRSN